MAEEKLLSSPIIWADGKVGVWAAVDCQDHTQESPGPSLFYDTPSDHLSVSTNSELEQGLPITSPMLRARL